MNNEWQELEYTFEEEQRIDLFLASVLPDVSRSKAKFLIEEGFVLINGNVPKKAGQLLKKGDHVYYIVPLTNFSPYQPEELPLEILFENQDVLVINKQAGIVVHPSIGHNSGTLVNALLAYLPKLGDDASEVRAGIVHRLDKDTSGVMVIAKNEPAIRFIQAQFKNREVEKQYLALVEGVPRTIQGRIETNIGRDDVNRHKRTVLPPEKGKAAVSIYRVLRVYEKHSLLEVHPLTGRTHQIRVHLAFIGCPVVGDSVYGFQQSTLPIQRHFLHASRLVLKLPGETQKREFVAPLPADLVEVLKTLENRMKSES